MRPITQFASIFYALVITFFPCSTFAGPPRWNGWRERGEITLGSFYDGNFVNTSNKFLWKVIQLNYPTIEMKILPQCPSLSSNPFSLARHFTPREFAYINLNHNFFPSSSLSLQEIISVMRHTIFPPLLFPRTQFFPSSPPLLLWGSRSTRQRVSRAIMEDSSPSRRLVYDLCFCSSFFLHRRRIFSFFFVSVSEDVELKLFLLLFVSSKHVLKVLGA